MKYCADTWFILYAFDKDERGIRILREIRDGKARMIVPIIVFVEATKKLLQRGASQMDIELFWSGLEASEKIELTPIDYVTAWEAARISLSHDLSLVDALIGATCRLSGCHALLTGDHDYQSLVKKKYLDVVSW